MQNSAFRIQKIKSKIYCNNLINFCILHFTFCIYSMVYDVIIVWWGASGLFCSLSLPKELKKCIIEKTDRLGFKVLLSGWERCNVSNIYFDPQFHYIGQFLKSLPSLFYAFGPEDMITYLHDHAIETKIEENGRVILKSWKAKELVDFLIHESKQNETEHLLNHEVYSFTQNNSQWNAKSSTHDLLHFAQENKENNTFVATTSAWIYTAHKVIIATWGMSYPQIGASSFAYELAEQLWLSLVPPHAALCGIETQGWFPLLSWNTVQATISLFAHDKVVYTQKWSLLFTHRGLSGPVIFDASLFIDQHISNYTLQCDFDFATATKKVLQAFSLTVWDTVRDIPISALRPMTEAKVTVWGILLNNLDQHFQSKKNPWLYFIGEALDLTGKTWGYNLQRARTSGYVCAKNIGARN